MDGSDPASNKTLRVLIVDRDPRVRRGLRALLETQPDIVVIGESDSDTGAVRRAAALHPSVVLLDLMLPTLPDGLATVQLLAAHRRPCIATCWQSSVREAALALGAAGFVEKGGSPEHLLAAIRGTSPEPASQRSSPQRE